MQVEEWIDRWQPGQVGKRMVRRIKQTHVIHNIFKRHCIWLRTRWLELFLGLLEPSEVEKQKQQTEGTDEALVKPRCQDTHFSVACLFLKWDVF